MKKAFPLVLLLLSIQATAQNRIASLNLCTDQLLLNWIAPERIASITWLSATDQYRKAPLPEHIYLNRGRAEELLRLDPDLVLVGQYGAQRAAGRLRQLGFEVADIPDAYSLEQLSEQLQALENVLGENAPLRKQRQLLQKLLAQPPAPETASALILSANNITYGSGMLEHQLLERAGFENLAAADGAEQLRRVSLEEVIAAQPDLLVLYGGDKDFALAHLAERHPVLQRYFDSDRVFKLPSELSFCPALVAAEVLQQLTEKRKSLAAKQ
ncbi:ABC transporter substrate-binding protein [Microbulbifer halophilus]|uniref:ABC transporter substrate-binding protein n=1 Tax=Microbulbifer halophilus TaxID=453963 RepID=A0ABW5EF59_9GAMM|nr:ABC transporter substrate-binding protein [Microbulbifer halophilus]MCW8127683.1 ABC transporter substrate-binding protein [Microbulbifer halophilus]